MKLKFYTKFILILLMISGKILNAEVKTFSAPTGTESSSYYKIEVVQDLKSYFPFVYVSNAQLPQFNKSKTTSFTQFEFTGKIKIIITKLYGNFNECKVLPSSYGIPVIKEGNRAIFEIDRPRKVAIEFDGDITHPLLLFADAPEVNVPDPKDPNVIYFGPGNHDVEGDIIKPVSGQTVYIASGAIVNAYIQANNVQNVTIAGRGILSGRKFGHGQGQGGRHILFNGEKTENILVKDIIIIDSPGFYVTTSGKKTTIRNFKGMGWWFNTDGVSTGQDGLVEDCFLKCNDDAVKLYRTNTQVYRTTIWQMENGAPFQLSWNMPSDNTGMIVKDCDVIHADHAWDNPNNAVFNAIHGGSGHMSNYYFEDIRIENCNWRLFNILIAPNVYATSKTLGKISKIIFKNVTAQTNDGTPFKRINVIQGFNENHTVEDVEFVNLKINGKLISSAEEGSFTSSAMTTKDVRFTVTPDATPSEVVKSKTSLTGSIFEWKNPIRTGLNSYGQKDFHIYKENEIYYLVATELPNPEWGQRGIILYSSTDMINWREQKYLINKNELDKNVWYHDMFTSPEIHKIKGKYYLAFSARNDSQTPYGRLGLALAVSEKIEGPYTIINKEKPIVLGNNFNLFEDKDGTVYSYWDYMGRVYYAKLDLNSGKLLTEASIILGPDQLKENYRFIDAPFVMQRDNKYYMLFSSFYGGYVVRVRYVTADSPNGPWHFENNNPLMVFTEDEAKTQYNMPYSQGYTFAPPTQVVFHHQIIKGPGNNDLIVYHSSEKYSEPYLIIEQLKFAENGQIFLPANKAANQKIIVR